MGVVKEVLEKCLEQIGGHYQYHLLFLQVIPSLSDKAIHQNHEVIQRPNETFFLIRNSEFYHIHIPGVVLQTKHFLFQLMYEFFCFFYKHVRPIFDFWLCRSCYDQGLPPFQYNAIFQRHVYMKISDLPHSHIHLSKLSHRHKCRLKHCTDFY